MNPGRIGLDLSIMQLSAPRRGAGEGPARKVGAGAQEARLRKAVHEFEALFINYMLKTMRSTIQKSTLLGSGMREDIYTSLFDWELSRDMARSGGIGLGKMLLRDFQGRNAQIGAAKGKVSEARSVEAGPGRRAQESAESLSVSPGQGGEGKGARGLGP